MKVQHKGEMFYCRESQTEKEIKHHIYGKKPSMKGNQLHNLTVNL